MPTRTPTTEPFPHIVWDGFFDDGILASARAEFDAVPDYKWTKYDNHHERKWGTEFANGGPSCKTVASTLQHPAFIGMLEQSFGIAHLTYSDIGGGLHRIKPGGMLDVHVDFNQHPDGRYRRINVLIYLNRIPKPSADLWLCDGWPTDTPLRVPATFNRMVAFETSETSWHGHPEPLEGNEERRSLAAYYYTAVPPKGVAEAHSTIYLEDT